MSTTDMHTLLAWGQYLHWCDLQFKQFSSLTNGAEGDSDIGAAAYWLASEYVVLEGWQEIGDNDAKIDRLLALYPENIDLLRRCRNAVYHFQKEVLDTRIIKCLSDENEVLLWSVALHFEFQRFFKLAVQLRWRTQRAGSIGK